MASLDDDLDDVIEGIAIEEDVEAEGDDSISRQMSDLDMDKLSEEKKAPDASLDPARLSDERLMPPSENELRLERRLRELEKQKEHLEAELQALKADTPSSTTIPVSAALPPRQETPITIPHELLPTLNLLRHHIAELTLENQALRRTFLDQPSSVASSSKSTLNPVAKPYVPGGAGGINENTPGVGRPVVDLEAVVSRVKDLLRENEELGEMVIEAGKVDTRDWETALEESKTVIQSLDSDLQHHLDTVQTLRSQLQAYEKHFGPIPSETNKLSGAHHRHGPNSKGDKADSRSRESTESRERHRRIERHTNRGRESTGTSGREKQSSERSNGNERSGHPRADPPSGPRKSEHERTLSERPEDRGYKRRR